MQETFLRYKARIPAAPPAHNNQPQIKWQLTCLALPHRRSIFQRMRAKVDWLARMLQAREPMTSSALMLHHNNSSNSHRCRCSRTMQHLLKTIIPLPVTYWTYSQQISHLAKINSLKIINLMISSLRIISLWPQHKTKSPIMTNTLSLTVSMTKINSSSSPQEASVSKINSRLRATCRAPTPSAS